MAVSTYVRSGQKKRDENKANQSDQAAENADYTTKVNNAAGLGSVKRTETAPAETDVSKMSPMQLAAHNEKKRRELAKQKKAMETKTY